MAVKTKQKESKVVPSKKSSPDPTDHEEGFRVREASHSPLRWFPARWDSTWLTYPPGAVGQRGQHLDHFVPAQWLKIVELLRDGCGVGFNATDDDAPGIALEVAQKCDFELCAHYHRSDEMLYMARHTDDLKH